MSERVRGYSELRRSTGRGRESAPSGRHAFDEDAALTPIFHALNRGGWRGRQQEPPTPSVDEVDDFRRDPLTAPIPIQALAVTAVPAPASAQSAAALAVRRRRAAHALAEPRRDGGRHHFRREPAGVVGW